MGTRFGVGADAPIRLRVDNKHRPLYIQGRPFYSGLRMRSRL